MNKWMALAMVLSGSLMSGVAMAVAANPPQVPEPGTFALLALGIAGLAATRLRRK